MRMIGCDLHAAQPSIAMLDCETGEIVERTLTARLWSRGGQATLAKLMFPTNWSWLLRVPL